MEETFKLRLEVATNYFKENEFSYKIDDEEESCIKIELDISDEDLIYKVDIFFTEVFLVVYTRVPLTISKDRISELLEIINFINSKSAFGNFEYDPEIDGIYYKTTFAGSDESMNEDIFDHLIQFPIFTLSDNYPILSSINANLLSPADAMKKVMEKLFNLNE